MIVYIDVKDGKVDLTKKQLEKLLKDKYDEGYADGKKFGTVYYNCPYSYNYYTCPLRFNSPYLDWNKWTCTNQDLNVSTTTTSASTINSDSYTNATDSVTIKYNEVK